jgi:hypothetical protein
MKFKSNDKNVTLINHLNDLYEKAKWTNSGLLCCPTYEAEPDGSAMNFSSFDVLLYDNENFEGYPLRYGVSSGSLPLANHTTNYLYVDYNGGSPIVKVTSNVTLINLSTTVPFLTIFRTNHVVHINNWDALGLGLSEKILNRLVKTQRYIRETGLGVSLTPGELYVECEEGSAWFGAVRQELAEINTSITSPVDQRLFFFYHSGGAWALERRLGINNTQWDNGTNLVELTANRYAIAWIFRGIEDGLHLYAVAGRGDYTLSEAQSIARIPPLPNNISSHALFVAKIIIQKGAIVPTSISSAFDISLSPSPVANHGDLAGRSDANQHPLGSLWTGNISTPINQLVITTSNGQFTTNTIGLDYLNNVTLGTPQERNYLRFDGTNWVNDVITAGDVAVPALQENKFLQVNSIGTELQYKTLELDDITIPEPSVGQEYYVKPALVGSEYKLVYEVFPFIPTTLQSLSNVTITTPQEDDVLTYDGENWVNSGVIIKETLDELDDTNIVEPNTGDYLRYSSAGFWEAEPVGLADVIVPSDNDNKFIKVNSENGQLTPSFVDVSDIVVDSDLHLDEILKVGSDNRLLYLIPTLNLLEDVFINSNTVIEGHVVRYTGSQFQNAFVKLSEIQSLVADDGKFVKVGASGLEAVDVDIPTSINDLDDVDIVEPTVGEYLRYNSEGDWEADVVGVPDLFVLSDQRGKFLQVDPSDDILRYKALDINDFQVEEISAGVDYYIKHTLVGSDYKLIYDPVPNIPTTLNQLSDVTTSSVQESDLIQRVGSAWVNRNVSTAIQKGVANGVAPLDADNKVPITHAKTGANSLVLTDAENKIPLANLPVLGSGGYTLVSLGSLANGQTIAYSTLSGYPLILVELEMYGTGAWANNTRIHTVSHVVTPARFSYATRETSGGLVWSGSNQGYYDSYMGTKYDIDARPAEPSSIHLPSASLQTEGTAGRVYGTIGGNDLFAYYWVTDSVTNYMIYGGVPFYFENSSTITTTGNPTLSKAYLKRSSSTLVTAYVPTSGVTGVSLRINIYGVS